MRTEAELFEAKEALKHHIGPPDELTDDDNHMLGLWCGVKWALGEPMDNFEPLIDKIIEAYRSRN